jgi:hypothetical protein
MGFAGDARLFSRPRIQNPFIAMLKLRFKFDGHDASNTPNSGG